MAGGARAPDLVARLRVPKVKGLIRERLTRILDQVWDRRLAIVIAPAGSGKTTLLAQFAAAAGVPVAWLSAQNLDGTPESFLGGLERSLITALGPLPPGWQSVDDAVCAIERWAGPRSLLVIDDLHALSGSEGEDSLERLLDSLPPAMSMLAASRLPPSFDLSRLRLAGSLLELGPDELRFRSWEVECLFRDVYTEPLPPQEIADLARRTEGWAAALQFFHLATQGKTSEERRRALSGLGRRRSRWVREYLARNVLAQLPDDLQDFLVDSCVLGRLSGPSCDRFLGRSRSGLILQELARRQIFTTEIDESGSYRYHEVLRSFLETILIDRIGEQAVRGRYRLAATELESVEAYREALYAYCRAEDWRAAARLLGREDDLLTSETTGLLDLPPPKSLELDPWLLLGTARRHRASGRLDAAIGSYQQAEMAFASEAQVGTCRRERMALEAWLGPGLTQPTEWTGTLRLMITRGPSATVEDGAQPQHVHALLVKGLGHLLDGHVRRARECLHLELEDPALSPLLSTVVELAQSAAELLAGDATGALRAERVAERAERLEVPWLVRMARAMMALSDRADGRSEAAAVRLACERVGDRWGAAIAALIGGLGALRAGDSAMVQLEAAANYFLPLGAEVLEAWARCALTLARVRSGEDAEPGGAHHAERLARHSKVCGALAFAYLARAEAGVEEADRYGQLAASIAEETGLALPPRRMPPAVHGTMPVAPDAIVIRCFGSFFMALGGTSVELSHLKPKARSLLRLLALHADRPVHREVALTALWPDAPIETGSRNLHVAVCALRHLLEPDVRRGGWSIIVRDGEAYRLNLPVDAEVDIIEFDQAVEEGRAAHRRGEAERCMAANRRVIELHSGELLPEEGPAEWLLEDRERCRGAVVQASVALADSALEHHDPEGAAAACEAGLRLDRYRDGLWQRLIRAREDSRDQAAAIRVREAYHKMLAELGLPETGQRGTVT